MNKKKQAENTKVKGLSWVKRTDVILLSVLLVVAIVLFLLLRPKTVQGAVAVIDVFYGQGESIEIPLTKDGVYTIDSGALPVTLEVVDGSIRFIDSQCPDHDCEAFGWLHRDGEWAACLPAAVSITIVDEAAE